MNNKVKYGLKNVYYAKATLTDSNAAVFGTPKKWPGAVNLSLDAQGELTPFRADNIDYWVGNSNNGYSGDLESALVPDDFRIDILGEFLDENGVQIEEVAAKNTPFALLFQFEGDAKNTRHVLYNCYATRPAKASQTTEENTEPVTETVSITATSVYNEALDKDIVSAKATPDQATQYANWFNEVYQPEALPTPQSATLSGLSLGSLTLSPAFSSATTSYTAETSNASNTITATAESGVSIAITVNGETTANGSAATWTEGENTVVIRASAAGAETTSYTVTVTKS